MALPEGNRLFTGGFRANLIETNTDMELEIDCQSIKDTFAERFQLRTSVLHQSMCILKAGLSSSYDGSGQNIKKKYLMYKIPIKMLRQHAVPNSSLYGLKIYSSKGCRKASQICNCMYLADTAILNIRIFQQRYHFRLCVFASTGKYFN